MFALVLVIACILGNATGQMLMKQGMDKLDSIGNIKELFNLTTFIKIFTNPYVLLGLLCYGISLILWLGAMSTLNISFMYPLLSLAYVLTAVAAWMFFKESVTLVHWIGIILVVSGCTLIVSTKL